MDIENAPSQNERLDELSSDKDRIRNEQAPYGMDERSSSCSTADGDTSGSIVKEASSQSSENGATDLVEEVADLCHCALEDLEDVYACTPLQEGMMALTHRDSTAHTVEHEYNLPRSTDPERLHDAWDRIAQANPILRTRIVSSVQNGYLQAVVRCRLPWTESGADENGDTVRLKGDPSWKAGQPLVHFTFYPARHVLRILIHHLICDDWSMALLLREAEKAYHAEDTLATHPFRPLVDYVESTRKEAEEFWKEKFQDVETASIGTFPPLPSTGHLPHPGACRERSWDITPRLASAFTVDTKIRLSWAILQSFYVDSQNILFGAVNVGRGVPVEAIEEMTGPALTIVPVLARLRKQETVAEALSAMQQDWASSMPYEHVGLRNLMHLGPGPKAACAFQTLLAVEPRSVYQAPDMFANHRAIQRNYDLYRLILRFRPSATRMRVEAWFDPAVVDPRQIKRILGQLAHIYGQVETLPRTIIADIDPFSPEDCEEMLRLNSPISQNPPTRSCVHTLIADRAKSQEDALAIHSWDGDISYRRLDAMATSLAAYLCHSLKAGSGLFVPLLLPKSRWTAIAMLAVMKTGCAFVLLDPSYLVSRLKHMCDAVQAPLVITCIELAEKAAALSVGATFLIDDFTFDPPLDMYARLLPRVNPTSAVYATLTSGSTGKPKCAVVRHEGYVASATAHGHLYNFSPTARVLQFASPAFDSCIIENLSTLIMGGCVCIPTQDECHSRLATTIVEYKVNVACLTPSVARFLVPDSVRTLHTLTLVGEPVRTSDVTRWAPHLQLCNAYGSAECSAVFSVQPQLLIADPANIGLPTGGVGWVVDPDDVGRLMPLGSTGELLIEGLIVGAGYVGDPDQNSRAFVNAPCWRDRFGAIQHVPLYKSGDLVQCTGDGSFRYIGRKDTQVKLHGQRLELAEIEQHLHKCFPQATEVAVDILHLDSKSEGVQRSRPDTVLIGFIECGVTTSTEEARKEGSIFVAPSKGFHDECVVAEATLTEALPTYMVPSVLLPVTQIPLTPSGKLDRRFLLQQSCSLSWDDIQRYRAMTMTQSYEPFSLITKDERDLVLGSYVDRDPPYAVDNVEDILPVLDFQSFYITSSSLVSVAEIFSAPLDIRRLYEACARVLSHYSILRTIFVNVGEQILQVILKHVDPEFHFLEYDDPQSYIVNRSRDKPEATTKQGELLVSFTFITSRTRPDWGFIVRLSHAQYDGSSLPFLWQAIAAAYEGKELPATTQFRDVVYSRLINDHPESLAFWQDYLQSLSRESADPLGVTSTLQSPQGNDATPLTVRREIEHNFRLPDITAVTLVMASTAWVLSRHSTLQEIILGQVVHGRGSSLPGMETVLGPCINVLPVRISLGHSATVDDLLHHVQGQQLAIVSNDAISWKQIVDQCTDWPQEAKLGCIVHHQAAVPQAGASSNNPGGNVSIGGVLSSYSTSWENSTPTPGHVRIISIERGRASLDLYMTFPTERVGNQVAEQLADAIAHTIRLFAMFPDCSLEILKQGGEMVLGESAEIVSNEPGPELETHVVVNGEI
ncbi:hypothetical protein BJX64DRAFT_289525 [Aspergillus heterothallicus]